MLSGKGTIVRKKAPSIFERRLKSRELELINQVKCESQKENIEEVQTPILFLHTENNCTPNA